ncbi:uncharacterized protein LOC110699750 [Chenopodium quinoa]|uniref:uncharacterized protein LOC110699750 n=1 Tax=Chenopodium quinoa TaxID=63459 RepID=UPI000B791F36|nr:uncharacterized protein LOC110699750 [Chenopodium quinoa]
MAKDDDQPPTPPPPPPSNDYHPANSISNIKNEVPEILDHEKGNYGSWVELFEIHCHSYNVIDHIDLKSPRPTDLTTAQWNRLVSIMKKWIYNTIYADLRSTVLYKNATAQETWDRLANIFQDNGLIDSDYDGVAQSITQIRPLPGFDEARSRILLEESRKSAKDNSGQAFVAQESSTTTTTAAGQQQQPPQQ